MTDSKYASLSRLNDSGCACHINPPCDYCTTFDPDITFEENIARMEQAETPQHESARLPTEIPRPSEIRADASVEGWEY